jgi:type IV pilus assembly protein PilW
MKSKSIYKLISSMKNPKQTQGGMTLVELLVAMAISLFLLAAIGLVYMTSKTGFTYANNTSRMSEDASFAVESVSRDIRMAGFAGCTGASMDAGTDGILYTADDVPKNPKLDKVTGLTLTAAQQPNPFSTTVFSASTAVLGFDGTGTAAAAARTALGTSSSYTMVPNSAVLYVAGGSANAVQINTITTAASDRIEIGTADPYNWSNNFASSAKPFFLISDCKGSEVFRASSMATSAGIKSLVTDTSPAVFLNTYSQDAIIMPLVTSTYFLATRTGATNPSLYRRNFNGSLTTVEEIVPNVEAMTFQYGENTSCINNDASCTASTTPSYRSDVYRADSTSVLDWSRVVSVRIGLIMVSEDASQTTGADPAITWLGGTYTPASTTDRRLRRPYSTTVSIRNRMGV